MIIDVALGLLISSPFLHSYCADERKNKQREPYTGVLTAATASSSNQ